MAQERMDKLDEEKIFQIVKNLYDATKVADAILYKQKNMKPNFIDSFW